MALIVILSVLYGLIHLIPVVGDIADSVAWPFLMLLGFGQAILLIGMVGYPLMYATISAEGSDTFDALSRSYNYVLQSPWNYIWYSIVAIVYGAVLVFFVGFVGSMVVYLTKWSVGLTPGTEYFASRRVENLFIYAPTSFGWRDLLIGVEPGMDPDARVASLASSFYWWNYLSAAFVSFWVTLIFLLVIGFAYSYYFTAFTKIYFLMRRKVDDVDLDEVYLEEDEPDEPHLPPVPTQRSARRHDAAHGGCTAAGHRRWRLRSRRRNAKFPRVTDAPTDPALHRAVRRCAAGRPRGQGRRLGLRRSGTLHLGRPSRSSARARAIRNMRADRVSLCASHDLHVPVVSATVSAKPFATRSIAGTKRSFPITSGATGSRMACSFARPRN